MLQFPHSEPPLAHAGCGFRSDDVISGRADELERALL
jgi:hypothetical protein